MSELIDYKNLDGISENEIARLIEYHDKRYWELGEPEISDEEYDLLARQLEKLNPDHPLLLRLGSPSVAGTGKVRHKKPMLSLDKAYSLEELLEWAKKYVRNPDEEFIIQPKYDGISANFDGSVLATRGDGEEGENITDKIPLIELESAGYKGPLKRQARGEIVIRNDDFKTRYSSITKKDGNPYKNSRNAVAGIMGLKDIADMKRQNAKLTFVDYEMISEKVSFHEFRERWPAILENLENLPYPMDGLVVKLADEKYSESLGFTAHHPRGQIAFKFSGVRKTSTLLDVEWSFGKNCLTPVAELEPVEIGGITIRHATLHNAQNIKDKDIKIGDTITVERAGDVIPYVINAIPGETRKDALISICPCCKAELVFEKPELRCVNPECFETRVQRLLAAVRNIGIERLGEPNIRRMMTKLNVKTLRDIFELGFDDIVKLEGFKEKSANNLVSEIKNARKTTDFQLLASLNIQGIGKNLAKSILTEYTLDGLRKLDIEKLSSIDGVGPERAFAIEKELKDQSVFIDELLQCVELAQTKGSSEINLPTICFTGKMPEKRSYYEGIAKSRGYSPVDTVSSELSILVAADISSGSSKIEKARAFGVKLISLDEWLSSSGNTAAPVSPEKKNDDFMDLPLFFSGNSEG
ncbi:MAG: hypothetical protein A2020_05495 [Lentisphaerae bacterium GWF2_45_14]|nr:MAG: hypothetical protein A2020_05495 [Lentisphaerae bacterium GWF2_45_14]